MLEQQLRDFAYHYFRASQILQLEMGSIIYSYQTSDGQTAFSYTKPLIGSPKSIRMYGIPNILDFESKQYIPIATIHTHPRNDHAGDFSDTDIVSAQRENLPSCLVHSQGISGSAKLLIYDGIHAEDGTISSWHKERLGLMTDFQIPPARELAALYNAYHKVWLSYSRHINFPINWENWPLYQYHFEKPHWADKKEFRKILEERYIKDPFPIARYYD